MSGHVSTLALILGDADFNTGGECNSSGRRLRGKGAGGGKAALGNPAAVDTPDNNGSTPLWAAAARGHLDTVEYLVGRCGASPHARDARGTTAAWMAVSWSPASFFSLPHLWFVLFSMACPVRRFQDRTGDVFFPQGQENLLSYRLLFFPPTDVFVWSRVGGVETRTHKAYLVSVYLPESCEKVQTEPPHLTPANSQAESGHTRCLMVLLGEGADGSLANDDGFTPALVAAQGGHAECLRVLAMVGADLSVTDPAGNSAAGLAAMGGHINCLEVYFVVHGRAVRHPSRGLCQRSRGRDVSADGLLLALSGAQ